jgi:predicted DNA-binding ribbon-helix-helix protein
VGPFGIGTLSGAQYSVTGAINNYSVFIDANQHRRRVNQIGFGFILTLSGYRGRSMTSTVLKRSTVIANHKTSVSLEDQFWSGLKEIALARHETISNLVDGINAQHEGNLSSAIRRYVLAYYRDRQPAAGDIQSI